MDEEKAEAQEGITHTCFGKEDLVLLSSLLNTTSEYTKIETPLQNTKSIFFLFCSLLR
jgi:hypothetical protein